MQNQLDYNQKLELTKNVKELNSDKLGKVVEIIKTKCSLAYRDLDGENCQIIVDNLDRNTYEEINKIIAKALKKR